MQNNILNFWGFGVLGFCGAGGPTASYELARTVPETLANSSTIPQYVYHQPELDSEEPLGCSGTRVPPRCFCLLGGGGGAATARTCRPPGDPSG